MRRYDAAWRTVLHGVAGDSGEIVEVAASRSATSAASRTGRGTGSGAAWSGARASSAGVRTSAGTSTRARCPGSPTAQRACSGSRPQAAGYREAARRRLGTSCSSTGMATASPTTWASWNRATASPCEPSRAIRATCAGEASTTSEAPSSWGTGFQWVNALRPISPRAGRPRERNTSLHS